MLKIFQKGAGLIFALAFIAAMLFGLSTGMDMRQNGTMSNCMFDQSVTCPMNYREHIDHWQQTFTATHRAQNTILALLMVIVLGGAALLFSSLLKRRAYAQATHHVSHIRQRQYEITAKLSNPVLRALSDGILNPRLYNLSRVIR